MVALEGEQADPRVPAPTALRPVLRFTRLSASSYGLIERVVDDDPEFRARVAAAATEADVGRAGWLWLTRPEGWEADPVFSAEAAGAGAGAGAGHTASARLRRERAGAEAAAARHRRQAEQAETARRQAEQELAAARAASASAATAAAQVEQLTARVAELEAERTQLVRQLKAAEADGTELRRDLKVAREATRQAEAELLAGGSRPAQDLGVEVDRRAAEAAQATDAARGALEAAARAAGELARSLDDAAAALAPGSGTGSAAQTAVEAGGAGGRKGSGRGRRRRPPAIPGGLVADSPEVHRHLLLASGATVVVDGYNLARTAWPDLAPEEERRRTVVLLEELHARTGAPVTVVFDGDSSAVSPVASRIVRVRYSPSGVTADDAIAELLAALPVAERVLVVSSDREVADDARRQGAAVLGSRAFLAALGR